MKRLVLGLLLLLPVMPAQATPGCSHLPGALATLCEDLVRQGLEIRNAIAFIMGKRSKGMAEANAEKQKTSAVVWVENVVNIARRSRSLKRQFGSYKPVFSDGHIFLAGAISGLACLKQKEEETYRDVVKQVIPKINESIETLGEEISADDPPAVRRKEMGEKVKAFLGEKAFRTNELNPLNIDAPIPIETLPKWLDVVQYVTNPALPMKNYKPPYNAAQYHRTRIRYEMFVKTLQAAVLHDLGHFVTIGSSGSEYHLFWRIKIKHNTPLAVKSLAVKTEIGVDRHINQVLADIQIVKAANARINEDINSLMALMATETTDEIAQE